MAQMSVKVTGLREIDKALGELPKATARNVLKRTLMKAGQPIADHAERLIPSPGKTGSGALRRHGVNVSTRKPEGADAGKAAFAAALRAGSSRQEAGAALRSARAGSDTAFAEAFVGPGRHPQAIFQEFGTVNHGPQSFMRPAWDAEKMTALDIIRTESWAEIEKAARRLAAKAARGK